MTTSEIMLSAGFVKSPNNIHSLPGDEWYACGPGKVTVKIGEELRVIDGKVSIWTTKYYDRPDGSGFMFHISGIVAEFEGLDKLLEHCSVHGRISTGGIGPSSVYNMWD